MNDKHIEVIVRQMMRKVRIEDAGDTKLLRATVDISELRTANERSAHQAGELSERASAARGHLHPAAHGHHQGLPRDREPLRRLLPGDDQGPHRGRHQGQGRPPRRPQGERHHRQAHPRRLRPVRLPELRLRDGRGEGVRARGVRRPLRPREPLQRAVKFIRSGPGRHIPGPLFINLIFL
ncbi:MAG: hypothetical protein ACLUEK_07545 [Oscillospiraceae bacterium]